MWLEMAKLRILTAAKCLIMSPSLSAFYSVSLTNRMT